MDGRASLARYIDDNTTQVELAGKAKISESHLSLYLSGARDISVRMARRLSAATGIPASELLGLETDPRK